MGITSDQLEELYLRQNELSDELYTLKQLLLSGGTVHASSLTRGADGAFSERKARELAHELTRAYESAITLDDEWEDADAEELDDPAQAAAHAPLPDEQQRFLASFFYCAVHLSADSPWLDDDMQSIANIAWDTDQAATDAKLSAEEGLIAKPPDDLDAAWPSDEAAPASDACAMRPLPRTEHHAPVRTYAGWEYLCDGPADAPSIMARAAGVLRSDDPLAPVDEEYGDASYWSWQQERAEAWRTRWKPLRTQFCERADAVVQFLDANEPPTDFGDHVKTAIDICLYQRGLSLYGNDTRYFDTLDALRAVNARIERPEAGSARG